MQAGIFPMHAATAAPCMVSRMQMLNFLTLPPHFILQRTQDAEPSISSTPLVSTPSGEDAWPAQQT